MRFTNVYGSLAVLTTLFKISEARAEDCSALIDEPATPIPKIYIENGDTQEPLVKRLGKLLVASRTPLRIIYRNRPTCNIRDSLFDKRVMTEVREGTPAALRTVRYIPVDPTQEPRECNVPLPADAASAQRIELGIGATYISSCSVKAQPTDVAVREGPVQAYGFITHKSSSQVAITAEEGYLAYGFAAGAGEAQPWVVQELRFKRGNTASTTLTMSSAVRLKPLEMKAAPDQARSEDIITGIIGASNPEASLGILGTELFDQQRASNIKMLAFKTFGQRFAYFPDRTNATFDKENVRDGHYLPWAPTPYILEVDASRAPVSANALRIYELVMGLRTEATVDGLLQVVQSGLVPKCAMKVTRSGDGADLSLYSDPAPCGCYFESKVPGGATTACTACTNDATCNGGTCRLGFCEAK